MSTTPLFSIITVTYNAMLTIEPTLDSVARQSFKNYEYIVIDGHSLDNTVDMVRQSGVAHTIVVGLDDGIYDAMNKGLQKAQGEYLVFLNAGDAFHSSDTLQLISDSIGKERPEVIYGETAIVDADRRFLMMRRLQAPEHLTWRSFANGMLVCHQAFIARRDIAPLYDLRYRYSSDVDWCIRCMKQARQLHNTHLTLIDYLNEGETTRHHAASLKERFKIMCHYYGCVPTVLRHIKFAFRHIVARCNGKN